MSNQDKMVQIRLEVPLFVHNKLVERQKRRKMHGLRNKTIAEVAREYIMDTMLAAECRKERS